MANRVGILLSALAALLILSSLASITAQGEHTTIRFLMNTGLGGPKVLCEYSVSVGETVKCEASQIIMMMNDTRFMFLGWYNGSELITHDNIISVIATGTEDVQEYIAKYQVQYLIELDLGYKRVEEWGDRGKRFSFKLDSTLPMEKYVRWIFVRWEGDLMGKEPDINIDELKGPIHARAVWRTQYFVEVRSEYPVVSEGGWFDEGEKIVIEAEEEVIEMNDGESRAELVGFKVDYLSDLYDDYEVEGGSVEVYVKAPAAITVVWKLLHHVILKSSYVFETFDEWVEDGSVLDLGINETVVWPNGTMAVFDGWSGDVSSLNPNLGIEVRNPIRALASWRIYYRVSVDSKYDVEVEPKGWVERGTPVIISAEPLTRPIGEGVRAAFQEWEGSIMTQSPRIEIHSLEYPIDIEARWVREYLVSVEAPESSGIARKTWVREGEEFRVTAPEDFAIDSKAKMVFDGWEGCPVSGNLTCMIPKVEGPTLIKALYHVERLVKLMVKTIEGERLEDVSLLLKSAEGNVIKAEAGEVRWLREGDWVVEEAIWKDFDVTSGDKLRIDKSVGESLPITVLVYRTSFKVMDFLGLPVKGAEVVVETEDGEILYSGETDEEGIVSRVGPLPPINLTVRTSALGFVKERSFDLRTSRPILLTLPLSQTALQLIAGITVLTVTSATILIVRIRRKPRQLQIPELPPPIYQPPPTYSPPASEVPSEEVEEHVVEKAEVVTLEDIKRSLELSGERLEDIFGEAVEELKKERRRGRIMVKKPKPKK